MKEADRRKVDASPGVFKLTFFCLVLFLASISGAEELRYQPVNPSFGGYPSNGSYLLQDAKAQNGFSPPDRRQSPAERFSETIQSAILSRVARNIAESIMGENAKESGDFQVGDLTIHFEREGENIRIDVNDPGRKGETTIRIPSATYGF